MYANLLPYPEKLSEILDQSMQEYLLVLTYFLLWLATEMDFKEFLCMVFSTAFQDTYIRQLPIPK